jgi:HSP20 family molecular chaperone IbpA
MLDTKKLKAGDKAVKTASPAENKHALVFKPPVDIAETDRELILIADMPGVAAEDVMVDLRDDVLIIGGSVRPWEGAEESDIRVEFEIGRYFRQFTLPRAVDRDRIEARCAEGTLRLILPKTEKALPRNIQVKSG